jgi:hypothetical protein
MKHRLTTRLPKIPNPTMSELQEGTGIATQEAGFTLRPHFLSDFERIERRLTRSLPDLDTDTCWNPACREWRDSG